MSRFAASVSPCTSFFRLVKHRAGLFAGSHAVAGDIALRSLALRLGLVRAFAERVFYVSDGLVKFVL